MPEAPHLTEFTGDYQCLHEFIPAARAKVDSNIWGYLIGATESETTLRRNRAALDAIALRPRVLRDVSKVDATTTFLGMKLRLPVMLAPVGSLESFHPGGAATAGRGATEFGVPIIVSSVTKPGLEEAAKAATGPKIFQLYVRGDDAWVDDVAHRAVDAGYNAFAITIDTAAYSRRERDITGALRQAMARGGDRARSPGELLLGQREAVQGQAQHSVDPEGHRHGRGCGDRLRARRRCGVRVEPWRAAARPWPRLDGRAARGDGRGARPGAGGGRRQLRARHRRGEGDRAGRRRGRGRAAVLLCAGGGGRCRRASVAGDPRAGGRRGDGAVGCAQPGGAESLVPAFRRAAGDAPHVHSAFPLLFPTPEA